MRRRHPELAARLEQDDAVQEVALYILTHPDVPLPLGFVNARWHLVKLATREKEEWHHATHGAEEVEGLPEEATAGSSLETERGVEAHVKPLPPAERFVLLATYYGFKRAEIAASLHVSERTVSRLLSQALTMLGIGTGRVPGRWHSGARIVAPPPPGPSSPGHSAGSPGLLPLPPDHALTARPR
jgi:DNA-directed RNA polymerase specialized sigma24 family protein